MANLIPTFYNVPLASGTAIANNPCSGNVGVYPKQPVSGCGCGAFTIAYIPTQLNDLVGMNYSSCNQYTVTIDGLIQVPNKLSNFKRAINVSAFEPFAEPFKYAWAGIDNIYNATNNGGPGTSGIQGYVNLMPYLYNAPNTIIGEPFYGVPNVIFYSSLFGSPLLPNHPFPPGGFWALVYGYWNGNNPNDLWYNPIANAQWLVWMAPQFNNYTPPTSGWTLYYSSQGYSNIPTVKVECADPPACFGSIDMPGIPVSLQSDRITSMFLNTPTGFVTASGTPFVGTWTIASGVVFTNNEDENVACYSSVTSTTKLDAQTNTYAVLNIPQHSGAQCNNFWQLEIVEGVYTGTGFPTPVWGFGGRVVWTGQNNTSSPLGTYQQICGVGMCSGVNCAYPTLTISSSAGVISSGPNSYLCECSGIHNTTVNVNFSINSYTYPNGSSGNYNSMGTGVLSQTASGYNAVWSNAQIPLLDSNGIGWNILVGCISGCYKAQINTNTYENINSPFYNDGVSLINNNGKPIGTCNLPIVYNKNTSSGIATLTFS